MYIISCFLLLIFIVAITMGIFSFLNKTKQAAFKHSYDSVIQYKINENIEFPDFDLKYTGMTETDSFVHYEFEVVDHDKKQEVVWASSGIIGPQTFLVSGIFYHLELYYSDTQGKLKDGELVVRRGIGLGE